MIRAWNQHIVDYYNGGLLGLSENNVSASFNHPGLCLRHFDRDGNLHIVDVMSFFNEVRNVSVLTKSGPNGANHIDFMELLKGRLVFVVSTEIEMTRECYDRSIPKWPLKVTNFLGYLGNSSLTIGVNIYLPDTDILLMNQNSSYALVDRETRKSKPFPDWYKLKYGGKGINTRPCKVETLAKPNETFYLQTKVFWTETDGNNHTNYAKYIQYVINALRSALNLRAQQQQQQSLNLVDTNSQGNNVASTKASASDIRKSESDSIRGLRGINEEILRTGVKSVRVCYTKESVEGDIIDVHIWQEEGNDLGVKAILESEGDALCHIHLEYFGTVASHL